MRFWEDLMRIRFTAQTCLGARGAAASLFAMAIALSSSAALAQGAAPAAPAAGESTGLEDIVVTARRVAENLQDVPVAITAFSGEALQQQNARQISDISRLTPSLTVRESPSNPSGVSITLRGQVQNTSRAMTCCST